MTRRWMSCTTDSIIGQRGVYVMYIQLVGDCKVASDFISSRDEISGLPHFILHLQYIVLCRGVTSKHKNPVATPSVVGNYAEGMRIPPLVIQKSKNTFEKKKFIPDSDVTFLHLAHRKEEDKNKASSGLIEDVYQDEVDHQLAFQCKTWPSIANDWKTRERTFQWLSAANNRQSFTLSCSCCTPACHSSGGNLDIEWKLSFAVAEKRLIAENNAVCNGFYHEYGFDHCASVFEDVIDNFVEPVLGKEEAVNQRDYIPFTEPEEYRIQQRSPDDIWKAITFCRFLIVRYVEGNIMPVFMNTWHAYIMLQQIYSKRRLEA
ncbi:unnamed protein product [Mytilus edulis]|uniref:Mab-21-like nucleotidyltransferase domain-containing protein n=1 Tax=Mytilus edulis TaxID=6550 RepID=A0A8S3TGJ9_MYTED|nr:unnamed protein product [Mytilus edulis]